MQAAANALLARAHALAASNRRLHDNPYRPPGSPSVHLAAARDQVTYQGVGEGFLWLSRVLPQAALGNWALYITESAAMLPQRIETFRNLGLFNTDLLYVTSTQEVQQLLERTISGMIPV